MSKFVNKTTHSPDSLNALITDIFIHARNPQAVTISITVLFICIIIESVFDAQLPIAIKWTKVRMLREELHCGVLCYPEYFDLGDPKNDL